MNDTKIMTDTLKIERAITGLTEWQKHVQTGSDIDRDIAVALEVLKAQLEPKTGHWVYRPEWSRYGDVWSCSECGEKTSQSVIGEPRFKYCPNCGADMRGEPDGRDS